MIIKLFSKFAGQKIETFHMLSIRIEICIPVVVKIVLPDAVFSRL